MPRISIDSEEHKSYQELQQVPQVNQWFPQFNQIQNPPPDDEILVRNLTDASWESDDNSSIVSHYYPPIDYNNIGSLRSIDFNQQQEEQEEQKKQEEQQVNQGFPGNNNFINLYNAQQNNSNNNQFRRRLSVQNSRSEPRVVGDGKKRSNSASR